MTTERKPALSHVSTADAAWFVLVASLAAFVQASVTAWLALKGNVGISRWALIDVAIVLALAVGLVFKKYWCAWLLVGYHILNQAARFARTGQRPGSLSMDL